MTFTVRWPDGVAACCYSPSLVVREHLQTGMVCSVDEFVTRSRTALTIASDRVRATYGFACTSAMAQLEEIETTAAHFGGDDRVEVLSC